MFVYNTVWRDRRVLKEADSLVRHGWNVTVIGLSLPRDPQPLYEVTDSGVVIRRVPLSLRVPEWRRKSALKGLRRRFAKSRRAAMRKSRAWMSRRHRRASARRRRASAWIRRQIIRATTPARWRRLPAWWRRRQWGWPSRATRRRPRTHTHRSYASALRRILRGSWSGAGNPLAMGWVALYAGVDRVSGGELDWWLNARARWSEFARRAAELAPRASVYHGHDLGGIGAAMAARDRHAHGAVVYDAHELYVEAGTLANRSATLKYLLKRVERAAYRRASAVMTVNDSIAHELQARYGPREVSVVYNCVAPSMSGSDDRIRRTLGLPSSAHIALYQGALTPVRGLRELVAAGRRPGLEGIHIVFMGFGPMEEELRHLAGMTAQLHVLAPVKPDELDAWVASADACVMTNQPAGLNELLSTPNKLFESLAAGVPVITSDFPERRAIVLDPELGPLGAVCDPTSPDSIAGALRSILLMPDGEMAAMRERCLRAARSRWNWESQERELLAVYDGFTRAESTNPRGIVSGQAA